MELKLGRDKDGNKTAELIDPLLPNGSVKSNKPAHSYIEAMKLLRCDLLRFGYPFVAFVDATIKWMED